MSREKAIELLEKKKTNMFMGGQYTIDYKNGYGDAIDQALALLQALAELQKQSPAGDFTEETRKWLTETIFYGLSTTVLIDKLKEACAHLDRQAEDNKNQAAEIKRLKKENDDFLKMTELLEEHPEGYEGPCYCKLCMSYG